jgi:hypothetical protein
MKDTIVRQCLDILKREDIKNEMKNLFCPVLDYVLCELNPYIYIIISLIFLVFILILANLILLIFVLKNKQISPFK